VRAPQDNRVRAPLQQRQDVLRSQGSRFFAVQVARLNLLDQSGAGLDQYIGVAAKPGQQLRKFVAGKGPAGREHGDNPDAVFPTAGLTAGSIPTIGTENLDRKVVIAAPVAVLHATTIAFAFRSTRNSVIATDLASTNCGDFSPYGTQAESAT